MERLKRIPGVRFVLALNERYGKDGGNHLAAAMTYYGFLSLFPLILLALAATGFVLASDTRAQVEWARRISDAIPGLGPLIGENIRSLIASRRGAGIAGLLGLVWSGTGLTNAAGYALSRVYRRPEVQGLVKRRVWSLASTAGLGVVALGGIVVSSFVGGLQASGAIGFGLTATAAVIAFALDVGLFIVAYRVLTAGWGPAFSRLWPGAVLAGAGWTAMKIFGTWFATRTVANASEIYGTFGSVVGALALVYLAARLFLYGAELNALLADERSPA